MNKHDEEMHRQTLIGIYAQRVSMGKDIWTGRPLTVRELMNKAEDETHKDIDREIEIRFQIEKEEIATSRAR